MNLFSNFFPHNFFFFSQNIEIIFPLTHIVTFIYIVIYIMEKESLTFMCNRKKISYFIHIYLLIGVLKWPKNISTHLPLLNTTGSINIYEYANLYTPTCWVFWEGHFCNSYLLKYSIAFIFFSPHNIVIVPFSEVLVSTGLSGCSIVLVEERSRSAREPEERPDMNRWVRIG